MVNTNVVFNSKRHLQKAIFAEIKINHRKWPFVIKNASRSVFSSQNISIWASKDPSFQAIFNGKSVLQKLGKYRENSGFCDFLNFFNLIASRSHVFEYFYKQFAAIF